MTTRHHSTITTPTGSFQVSVPNQVIDGDGFYISFNDHDLDIYGSETTALVKSQMERFFILNGDHRAHYKTLIEQGFDACLAYFDANKKDMNSHSDDLFC